MIELLPTASGTLLGEPGERRKKGTCYFFASFRGRRGDWRVGPARRWSPQQCRRCSIPPGRREFSILFALNMLAPKRVPASARLSPMASAPPCLRPSAVALRAMADRSGLRRVSAALRREAGRPGFVFDYAGARKIGRDGGDGMVLEEQEPPSRTRRLSEGAEQGVSQGFLFGRDGP